VIVAIRLSMPDRPGRLAQLAAEMAAQPLLDILYIEVMERTAGVVVDELHLEIGQEDPVAVSRRIEALPGVLVESACVVEEPPSPTAGLELAAHLGQPGIDVLEVLATGMPRASRSAWCLVIESADGVGCRSLAQSVGAPRLTSTRLPWMPLDGPRRLAPTGWMPTSWQMRAALGGLELAACPFGSPFRAVLLGRHSGLRFRASELRALELLVSMALQASGRLRPLEWCNSHPPLRWATA
jgi:hypothetical protein